MGLDSDQYVAPMVDNLFNMTDIGYYILEGIGPESLPAEGENRSAPAPLTARFYLDRPAQA